MCISLRFVTFFDAMNVPYWRTKPLFDYIHEIEKVPWRVLKMAENIWQKSPTAALEVMYLTHAKDPFLRVRLKGKQRTIYQWG